ncbi:MAG: choice-of-anchor J domain-containing protein [Muribaculaceae bacterium]|nr:choice-of-anchor J domain-containing protein [Muribaculaceae bacterium]
MNKKSVAGLVAGGLLFLSGFSVFAFTGLPGFTKLASSPVAERAKEKTAEKEMSRLPMVPRLDNSVGRLNPVPCVGSRSLVESLPVKAPSRVTSEEAGRIYGGVIYASNWTADNSPVGIYSFPINDGSQCRSEAIGDDYVVSGGVYANGQYHFVSYMSFMGMTFADLYTCDIETWTITRSLPVKAGAIPQDMAYDPTTGNVYGCFMNDNADGWVLGVLNLETGERRLLKDLDMIILSVGVNSKGEWYGVGYDGGFYRFDKETGDRTLIGSTGRHPAYSASGCFDLQTDKFYWECIEADAKGILYEIDTNTGVATPVTTIANNAEVVGMFIPVPEAADAAPTAVNDLKFDFEGGALSGEVVFTMPTMQFDGKGSLSGEFSWTVAINEREEATGKASPGEEVRVPVSVPSPGFYRANVSTTNAAGRSPLAMVETWIGQDMPVGVGNLNLVPGDGVTDIVLTWETPDKTLNGGFVDTDAITYDIVRMPDNKKVATGLKGNSFSETIPEPANVTLYSYSVTPVYNGYEGETMTSNSLAIGSANTPLYNFLANEDDFAYFQVIDANNDGETWLFDGAHIAARMKYSTANNYTMPMDDWLVTPRVRLKAGRMYRFAIDAGCYYSYLPERLEVKMGTSATPEGLNIEVIKPTVINNPEMSTIEGWFSVEEDGIYFFGIHAMSGADSMFLYVNNMAIEEGPLLGTPGNITSLSATAGAQGALTATLKGVAPTKTVDGNPLSDISEIKIVRDGRPIGSITGVKPGEKFEYVDEKAVQSENTYVLTAVNTVGAGYECKVSVYVGHDRPGLPLNVRATYTGGKSVTITWDAPAEGETGGYYDPSALTYTILRANDEKELATGVKELTFTDPNVPLNGYRQEFYGYYVYAQSPAGYGYGQLSNIVVVGEPYKMPFVETFANGKITNDPWDVSIPEESNGYWQLKLTGEYPDVESQDPEGGLVSFIPDESGDEGTLTSGTISVKGAKNPVVEFWWYYLPGTYDTVKLLLSKDGGEFKEIGEVRSSAESGNEGWRKKSVALTDLGDTSFIQIAFEARSGTGYNNIHLDNIRVKDIYDNNLAVLAVHAPARVNMGEKTSIGVSVENSGLNDADDYNVILYADDKEISSVKGKSIKPDEFVEVMFEIVPENTWNEVTTLSASLEYAKDEYEGDNKTPKVEVRVVASKLPAVNDLSGKLDEAGRVNLEWSEPEIVEGSGETVTDGAEEYNSFLISDFGDWWTVDVDGLPTFGIRSSTGSAVQYPNAGKPQAFIVFDPSEAGIPTEYSDGTPTGWAPRTGEKYFASFGGEGEGDNWLISPELPRVAQTISFYVKSQTAEYGYEKFEVLYSTTGTEVSDFTRIGDLRSAPVVWTEERVELPEGARYFAIRCVSNDTYVFMVDDITYLPAGAITEELSLIGYNVYRDGVKVTEKPLVEMSYVDPEVDGKLHSYAVAVVYDKGESKLSNVVKLTPSGFGEAMSESVVVSSGKGFINIKAPMETPLTITDTEGRIIMAGASNGNDRFSLQAGVYVVKAGSKVVKAIVR